MADFSIAFNKVLANEGGYVNDPSDPGGETYKGVARKIFTKWDGWLILDTLKRQSGFPANLEQNTDLQQKIKNFYEVNFWDKVNGDNISNQTVANSIFDFAVNCGVSTSATLTQMVLNEKTDGVLGQNSIAALNAFDPDHFLASFTVFKIARYVHTVKKRPESRKYFFGWVCRAIGE